MSMDIGLDTTLETERLVLRPVDVSDVDLVWEATRFEGFNDGMTWDAPASKEDIVEVIHRNLAHWQQGKDYIFTINLVSSGCPIGRVGIHKEDAPDTWNKRSQSVIQRLGFEQVRINPAGFYKNGNPVEEYEYELRRYCRRYANQR